MTRRALLLRLALAGLVILLLGALLHSLGTLDPAAVGATLSQLDPLPYLGAAGSFALVILVRARRWRRLTTIDGETRLRSGDALALVLGGASINALLPGRSGDLYRVVETGRRGRMSRARVAGAALIERVLDLGVLGVCFLLAGALTFGDRLPVELAGLVLFAALLPILAAPLLLLPGTTALALLDRLPLPGRLRVIARDIAHGGFSTVHRGTIVALLGETTLSWIGEGGRLFLVAVALGAGDSLGVSGALFAALVAALLSVTPFTPAGLGVTEVGLVLLLSSGFGIDPATGAAIALADRLLHTYAVLPVAALFGVTRR